MNWHKKREDDVDNPRIAICLFRDSHASGKRCDRWFTRLFHFRDSLIVSVSEDLFEIQLTGWRSQIGRFLGLVQQTPLAKIQHMERLESGFANVRIEFEATDGWCRCVELRLRNPDAFVDAIRDGTLEDEV